MLLLVPVSLIVYRVAGTWIDSRHTIHTHTVPPQLLKAVRGKTLSRERRKSDEELSPRSTKTKVSQSPSRKSAALFFDAFRPRSKSDATSKGKKSTNLISQMKNAVQVLKFENETLLFRTIEGNRIQNFECMYTKW